MKVAVVLSTKGRRVHTTAADRSLGEAAGLLAEHGVGALVVVEGDAVVRGVLSERDIVRALARGGPSALEEPVRRHMTEKVVTTDEDADLEGLMEVMTQGRFRHVPVVKDGRLVGLVSIGDIVKWRVEEIETERKALRDYIAT